MGSVVKQKFKIKQTKISVAAPSRRPVATSLTTTPPLLAF